MAAYIEVFQNGPALAFRDYITNRFNQLPGNCAAYIPVSLDEMVVLPQVLLARRSKPPLAFDLS